MAGALLTHYTFFSTLPLDSTYLPTYLPTEKRSCLLLRTFGALLQVVTSGIKIVGPYIAIPVTLEYLNTVAQTAGVVS